MEKQTVIEMRGITKRFGTKVTANKNVSIDVKKGEILAILGEADGFGERSLVVYVEADEYVVVLDEVDYLLVGEH